MFLATKGKGIRGKPNRLIIIIIIIIRLTRLIFLKHLYNSFAPTIKGKNKNKVDNHTGKCLPSQLYKELMIIIKTNMEILQGKWKEEKCRL